MARPRAIVKLTQDQKFQRPVIYGDPGVGKTPLIATAPKSLILDADGGTESAAISGSKSDKWSVRDHHDLLDVYEYLRHGGTDDYDWVWLDSMTIFQERGLWKIMEELHERRPNRDVWLPDKGEYGQNMNRISLWIKDMVDLPINFGFTAHVAETEDREGNTQYAPLIRGKDMIPKVCGYFNQIFYCETVMKDKQPHMLLHSRTHKEYMAKDRFFSLPQGIMTDPTMPRLIEQAKKRMNGRVLRAPVKKAPAKRVPVKQVPVKKRSV